MLAPALAGAALLTFMTSLASFSAPYIFGGGFRVMTTQIVASKLNGEIAMAQVETVTLAALAFAGLWAMRRVDAGNTAVVGGVRGLAPVRRQMRRPLARYGVATLGWGLALVLLLPHLTLLLISFVPPGTWTVELMPPVLDGSNYATLVSNPERLRPVLNSLWMAAVATVGAIALGLTTARLSIRHEGRLGRVLETLISVPWALPGTVFAVALATTFAVNQPWAGRLVLVGTPWLLPLAYLVRSLPLTGRSSLAGLRQFDTSLEEAAASLGAGRWRRLWRVVLPLLRPAVMAGASLAFITALGDFVTSIVLYTFDTRPISIEILSSLRLQETGVAAVYGVLADAGQRHRLRDLGTGPESLEPLHGRTRLHQTTVGSHVDGLRRHDRLSDRPAAAAVLRGEAGRRRGPCRRADLHLCRGAVGQRAAVGPAVRPLWETPHDPRWSDDLGGLLPAFRIGHHGLVAVSLALRAGNGRGNRRGGAGVSQRFRAVGRPRQGPRLADGRDQRGSDAGTGHRFPLGGLWVDRSRVSGSHSVCAQFPVCLGWLPESSRQPGLDSSRRKGLPGR